MDAMVTFRKSLEMDSAQPDAIVNLANLYASQGNTREAIKVCQRRCSRWYPMRSFSLYRSLTYFHLQKGRRAMGWGQRAYILHAFRAF